jgi:hypothetical protein
MRYLWLALVALLVPGGLLLLAIAIGKRLRTVSEPAISPLSAKHYRFTTHDEALAIRTLAKRAQAEKARRAARRLETRSEPALDARERHGMRRVH